jgi:putative acetyltransferase
MIKIRIAEIKDVEEITQLFYETINSVNRKDYPEEQILAWSDSSKNFKIWSDSINEQFFIVAEINFIIVGFASLDKNNCLDFMYVHKDFQGEEIATQLLLAIEKQASYLEITEIWTDSSITAKPFFVNKGFLVDKIYAKNVNGIEFENTILKKIIT